MEKYKDKDIDHLVNIFIDMKNEFNHLYSATGLISITKNDIQVTEKFFSKLAYHYHGDKKDNVQVIGITDGGIHLQITINEVSFVTVAGGH